MFSVYISLPQIIYNGYWRLFSVGEAAKALGDRLPISGAKVKNAWCYTSIPPIRLHGVVFT